MIKLNKVMTITIITALALVPATSVAFAYDQEKVDLAGGLEETMGHLWALELNLNEGNYELVKIHANHPVSELYASMKPALEAADQTAHAAIAFALNNLDARTGPDVPLADALAVVEEARGTVNYARTATIGDISEEANFKLIQMKMLLETSIVEYGVAVSGGQIVELAEFQDGLAFVVRAEQILDTIDAADIGHSTAASMAEGLAAVQDAYDAMADPSEVESLTTEVIDAINGVLALGYSPEKVDLAGGLEETMGHLWALELNLNEGNYELVKTHANHPVSELYASMKPALVAADPATDAAIANALNNLDARTGPNVSVSNAQAAIDATRDIVDNARDATIGDISEEANFKLIQMKMLLETSIVEYGVAVSGGQIVELAEFQDGLAFVVRAEQILDTIDAADIGHSTAASMAEGLAAVQDAYDAMADPSEVESLTTEVIDAINGVLALGYSPEKVDLAGGLEETMGHLWALELNLNEGNYELVKTHANHPVSELYASMKPALVAADVAADAAIANALNNLDARTGPNVSVSRALEVIEETRGIVDYARTVTIGDISEEANFKLIQMKMLLETSIVEYGVAVSGGQIVELAEFQDGLAFVVRAEQILDTIDTADVGSDTVLIMYDAFEEVQAAYDNMEDPSEVESLTNRIIGSINGVLGIESEEVNLQTFIDNIRDLLADVKDELAAGNNDLALSYAVKAYLDNYEFLELPLLNAGEGDLMREVETMLRIELQTLIREAPLGAVNAHIDDILDKIDAVENILN